MNYLKRNDGISLYTLIITIIVIIILAGISIYNGFTTADKSSLAKFTAEFKNFKETLNADWTKRRTEYITSGEKRTDAQVFYIIASGTDHFSNDREEPTSGDTDVISLSDKRLSGLNLKGKYAYRIKNDANVNGWKKNSKYYSNTETHWVTDKGDVFIWPGYLVSENGVNTWYINEKKYYVSNSTPTALTEAVSDNDDDPGVISVHDSTNGAVSILTINLAGETEEEKGPYVNYPSSQGTILCRALYNDSTNGLQIVAVNPVRSVKLGNDDDNPEIDGDNASDTRAINSYNNAIDTLNGYAEDYLDTYGIATDARCIGSDPVNKGSKSTTETFDMYQQLYGGTCTLRTNDNHYESDRDRLEAINAASYTNTIYGTSYWVASNALSKETAHSPDSIPSIYLRTAGAKVRYITSTGSLRSLSALYEVTDGVPKSYSRTMAFRPVFIINSNAKIASGEGTSTSPYEFEI